MAELIAAETPFETSLLTPPPPQKNEMTRNVNMFLSLVAYFGKQFRLI
jgi:hypothetical protein